ncbi:MAG: hypothetical protein GX803_04840 [Lentisphaerae bacterium]|jgi:hypothetical protein|nr:hypothetical protein [Lentisphaerota bacterium]
MPAHILKDLLIRIGLALGAGVLISIVPVALRNGRYAPSTFRRVFLFTLAGAALIGFFIYSYFLVAPHFASSTHEPAPVVYPLPPAIP